MTKKYDAVIIGFGKGGKTLAAYLAAQGKNVAIAEQSDKMYGGTCINVGCIPTKSLVDSARRAAVKGFASFPEKAAFYRAAVAEKTRLVEMLRAKNYHMLADLPNVTVYNGQAGFVDAHEVRIQQPMGSEVIYGERIFINTGSVPVLPKIAGIQESRHVYLSETMLALAELPEQLTIIGGGYIGLEFASMYAQFGSAVTVLQHSQAFIPREDDDVAAAVQEELTRRGVRFVFGAEIERVADEADRTVVHYSLAGQGQRQLADAVLVATGRRPNTEGLQPEAAGIELLPQGGIRTDAQRRTNVPHIWAMGDVAGGLQFTYVSLDDFRIVRAALTGGSYRDEGRNIPYSVFITPSLSRVGLTEKEAKKQGFDAVSAVLPAAAIPKAHVLKEPYGMLKATVDRQTKQILGASLFCEESYELINLVKLAMDAHLPYTVLRDQMFTHPTMSEALNDLFGKIIL